MAKLIPVKDNLANTHEILMARGVTPELPVKTLGDLNRRIWGIHRKKLTVIAARTSNGKSALAIQLAADLASQGKRVLFLSLEMYEQDVIERLFCQMMRVDNIDLLTGKFKEYQSQWAEFQTKLATMPLVITDMIGRSWQEIDEHITQMKTKPDVVFIDHVQEARDAGQPNQKAVIEEYLKNLRVMAIRENFAAVVLSQVNRAAQEKDDHKAPQLHHLKGTGYLEEGADVILLLHWPYYYSKKKGENDRFVINVAKNRNGRTGWTDVKYTPGFYLFEDYVAKHNPIKEDPEAQAVAELFGGEVTDGKGKKHWQD